MAGKTKLKREQRKKMLENRKKQINNENKSLASDNTQTSSHVSNNSKVVWVRVKTKRRKTKARKSVEDLGPTQEHRAIERAAKEAGYQSFPHMMLRARKCFSEKLFREVKKEKRTEEHRIYAQDMAKVSFAKASTYNAILSLQNIVPSKDRASKNKQQLTRMLVMRWVLKNVQRLLMKILLMDRNVQK